LRNYRSDLQRTKEEQVKSIKEQRITLDDIHTYVAVSNHNKVSKAVSKQLEFEEGHLSNLNKSINDLREREVQAKRRLEKTKYELNRYADNLNNVSPLLNIK
jgi:chromosome segregation ATPase